MLSLLFALTTSVSAANVYDTVCSGSFAAGETTALCQILDYSAYSSVKSILQGAGPITFFPVSNQGLSVIKWTPDFWQNPSNYDSVTASLQYLIFDKAVKSTDLQTGVMSVFETMVKPGNFANTSKAQVAGFYENPNYPPGDAYFCYGRDAFDAFTVSYRNYDISCDNGVVQFMDRFPTLPVSPLLQLKYAGFSQFLGAIQKAGLTDFISTAQGLTLFAPFDDVMIASQWSTMSLADLSTLIKSHVYVAAAQGQNGAVLYTGTFTATTLVDGQGNPTNVKMNNGLPMLYGAANNDYYPTLPARVIQNQIIIFNGVIQPVTNLILSKPITFSKVPLLPQQWTAQTIDPPQGQGEETYFFLDPYQAGNYYPSAHGFYYGPTACSKLETVTGLDSYVYYLNCPALCCYEVLGGDIKQWSISNDATYLGNKTIQSFGKNVEAEGWQMIYNPNTLHITYDYWVTYDATSGSPVLQRIDYSGVGVPPGAIQYQNYAEIPASQAQAFPSEFWLPQNCQPNNLLPCDPNEAARLGLEPAMTHQQRLETLVRFGDVHRVKNSPLDAAEPVAASEK